MRIVINLLLLVIILIAAMHLVNKITENQHQAVIVVEDKAPVKELKQKMIEDAARQPAIKPQHRGKPGETLETRIGLYKTLVYLPGGYHSQKKWPLIVFLHGAGTKGDSLQPLYQYGPVKYMLFRDDPNFIVVCPLCPEESGWNSQWLSRYVKDVIKAYPISEDQVYLTGISMGGHGTYALAQDYPHLFAAAAPLCGAGKTHQAARLKNVPIWIFHGALDEVVPVRHSHEMVRALQAVGADVHSTIYPDLGHDIDGIYMRAPLYIWFLSHKRGENKSRTSQPFKHDDVKPIDSEAGFVWNGENDLNEGTADEQTQ
jgi:predicted peptidase